MSEFYTQEQITELRKRTNQLNNELEDATYAFGRAKSAAADFESVGKLVEAGKALTVMHKRYQLVRELKTKRDQAFQEQSKAVEVSRRRDVAHGADDVLGDY